MKFFKAILALTATIFFYSCHSQNTENNSPAENITEEPSTPGSFNPESGIAFDSTALAGFFEQKPLFKAFKKDFDTIYHNNNYNYLWYDNHGLIESSSALISSINNVEQEGVNANIPYADSLDYILHSYADTTNKFSPDINTELLLTGLYFYYARKIYAGSLNSKTDSINWYLPRDKPSYVQLLNQNLSSGKMEEDRGPVITNQYEGLKNALAFYRDIDTKGGEVTIPAIKKSLAPNDSSDILPAFRQRLFQLGYITAADTSGGNTYASKLADVVKALKTDYTLKTDSLITSSLITELNVPAKKRSEQIMVNMERLRWIKPDSNGAKEFILVNIPQYTLIYYENAKPAWRCGVVVGKPMTKTVIFSGSMRYVVFSPYWNVPPSIINKEVKPGMARNKNYLASHHMEWNGGHVRQLPGPANSLGLVKFLFPNSNNIYLHDTPSKSLFNESKRAFSHGCVRVSQPRELAIRVLRQMPEWTPEKIDAAMHAGKEKTVSLQRTIPVYIGYFTAFMGPDGKVNFCRDVYERDNRLYDMLVKN